jgi:hypothetical protein
MIMGIRGGRPGPRANCVSLLLDASKARYLGLICGYVLYTVASGLSRTPFVVPGVLVVVYTIAIAWIIEAAVGMIWNGQSYALSSPLGRNGDHIGPGSPGPWAPSRPCWWASPTGSAAA